MSSPRRYARLRTWAGCLGLRLAIVGFVVVVTATERSFSDLNDIFAAAPRKGDEA